jgi:hypothetical protein
LIFNELLPQMLSGGPWRLFNDKRSENFSILEMVYISPALCLTHSLLSVSLSLDPFLVTLTVLVIVCDVSNVTSRFVHSSLLFLMTFVNQILQFQDHEWDSQVDYMFFRNNVPNVEKLSVRLLNSQGTVAYCCQCTWRSIDVRTVCSYL